METPSGDRGSGLRRTLHAAPLIVLGFGALAGAYIAGYFAAFPMFFPSFPFAGPVWTALILATGPLGFGLSLVSAYVEGYPARKRTVAALVVGVLLLVLAWATLPGLVFRPDW